MVGSLQLSGQKKMVVMSAELLEVGIDLGAQEEEVTAETEEGDAATQEALQTDVVGAEVKTEVDTLKKTVAGDHLWEVIQGKILKKVGNLVEIEVRDMTREAIEVTEGTEVILEKGIQDDISSP